MVALPWKKDEKSSDDLLNEEVKRQLLIMEKSDVDSPEYKFAFKNYTELHEEQLNEKKLHESKRSRWFSAICTGVLAVGTLTAEYWSPITSKWASSFIRPFKSK
mgnify:CR=1 FL=1